MPTVEIVLAPSLYACRVTQQHYVSVAVDVLRATTSMCAAMSVGLTEIVPLDDLEQLPAYGAKGYLLAGERGGVKLYGSQCGNSPTEYLAQDLTGQRLAYSTTNGTRCVLMASQGADRTFVGSFANLTALYGAVRGHNVVVLCSGWQGRASLEDTIMAGALAELLLAEGYTLVDDATAMALNLWRDAKADIRGFCQQASHLHRLMRLGCHDDVVFCLKTDTLCIVPEYVGGRIVVSNP